MQPQMPSLLIIDDDLPTLELYRRELSIDYHVLICQDRLHAEKLMKTPDLCAVILEPAMADGEGWGLLAVLRKVRGEKPVPVILCSSSDEKKRGIQEGARVFLIKPVLPADLHGALRRVMAGHRA
jgi:DNA-binding response OmpR family regulator